MTTGSPASGRGDIQRVVVADVAQIASHSCMAVGERESGRIVVEYSRGPGGDRMA